MYKDKDKRRDKDKDRQRRYRASKGVTSQDVTEGVTSKAVAGPPVAEPGTVGTKLLTPDKLGDTPDVVPKRELTEAETAELHKDVHMPGQDWYPKRGKDIKLADELSESIKEAGKIRRGEIKASRVTTFLKRGKDIKTFKDLPPGVQQTINTLSDDKTEHKRRTAIAINYQHQFPDRYHSVGVQ